MTGNYWKKICAIPAYMFLLSPSGTRVQKMEGGNWIDKHEAQKVVDAAEDELSELRAENEVAWMRIKELDLLFGRYILAMRAAVIEENPEKGMEWIYNSLAGPGELPPEDETDAQAYFDREIVAVDNGMQEVLAFHDARRAAKEASHG